MSGAGRQRSEPARPPVPGPGRRAPGPSLIVGLGITQIVGYIREHFDQKTKRSASYRHGGKRLAGFNSLFATASIDAHRPLNIRFLMSLEQVIP